MQTLLAANCGIAIYVETLHRPVRQFGKDAVLSPTNLYCHLHCNTIKPRHSSNTAITCPERRRKLISNSSSNLDLVVLSKTNRERGYVRTEDAYMFIVPGSKFVQNYDVYMPKKYRNGQYFALVLLSKTNRLRGHLRPEDAWMFVVPRSRFVQNYDVYMQSRCKNGEYFAF